MHSQSKYSVVNELNFIKSSTFCCQSGADNNRCNELLHKKAAIDGGTQYIVRPTRPKDEGKCNVELLLSERIIIVCAQFKLLLFFNVMTC